MPDLRMLVEAMGPFSLLLRFWEIKVAVALSLSVRFLPVLSLQVAKFLVLDDTLTLYVSSTSVTSFSSLTLGTIDELCSNVPSCIDTFELRD